MQKWKCRLRRGMALALAAMVIGGGTSIMTIPVSAENETVNTVEKKEQVDFHFPESKVRVVEKCPDFVVAAEGAAEGSTVTYTCNPSYVATVDNNGKVHVLQEGVTVITATASETDEYKSKEISYELDVLGYCPSDAEVAITKPGQDQIPIDDPASIIDKWKPEDFEVIDLKQYIKSIPVDEYKTIIHEAKKTIESLPLMHLDKEWSVEEQENLYSLNVCELKKIMFDDIDQQIETDEFKSLIVHFTLSNIPENKKVVSAPVIYDVNLMEKHEDGTQEVATEDFPKEGIKITVPYPEGTNRHKHDFVVCHMFTHEMNGRKSGDMEFPKVIKGENGITFTVTGLSPIAITCVEAKSEEDQTDDEKKVPQVVGDTFVWENGEVKIPVDFGGYTAEDIGVSVDINNGSRMLAPTLEDNNIVISVFDFWREELERGHSFSKKGDYAAEVSFRTRSDYNEINTNKITIKVPADETSQIWNANQKTAKFDGTQDVTFTFANGTDFYALQSISDIEFFAWKYLEINGERCHNFSVGEDSYTYDMNAGTLTLSKEAIEYGIRESAKLWVKSGEDIANYPKEIIINATAESKSGKSVYYLSSISVKNPETGFIGTDGAWKIDITDNDLNLEDLEDKNSEFSVSSDQITVSEETGSVIESKIKNAYAEQLTGLEDNYTIFSKLNLTPQDSSQVQQEVKDGFQAQLGSKENIGQFYDINISAYVLQNGSKVTGLENISVNKLDQKITINLQIPEILRKGGRTYKILHYNSETKNAEVLSSKVKDWIISFDTDSFSPYALAYSDRTSSSGTNKPIFSDINDNGNGNQSNQGNQENQGNQNQPNNTNQSNNSGNQSKDQNIQNNSNTTRVTAPKTADNNLMIVYLIMMLCSICVLVGVRKYRYCK